jgi:CubicO group peptidase (beta-lactamase class C family)
MEIQGLCDDRFEPVREAFLANFAEAGDVGASFAVTVEGEFVVDIWAGYRDAARTLPWERDTLVNVYSTTKTMTALCALLLADRGELDFNAPVARYWPEFAQNGKEAIEVRHLMSHSAGLSGVEGGATPELYCDWDAMCERLEKQAPWWEPGSQSGYHAITQGYLVGEVVRRITGRSLGTFFREELAEPLGADFHIGVSPSDFDRIAELVPPSVNPSDARLPPGSVAARTLVGLDASFSSTEAWRRAEIPAANGHGNARSVVRVQTLLANGGSAFGRTLMSPAGCARVMEEQTSGKDLVLGAPLRFGLGYGLNGDVIPLGPNANTCYWGGWGGSTIVVDQDAHVCFSYVMNRMGEGALGDRRGFSLATAVFESLA